MKITRLLEAMSFLVAQSKIKEQEVKEELTDLLPEFLEEIYRSADLASLERKILAARTFNTTSALEALDIIAKHNPQPFEYHAINGPGRKVEPSELVEKMRESLKTISDKGQKWNPLEIYLRLEMWLDPNFDDLLISFEAHNRVFDELYVHLLKKLKSVSNDEILLLWARVLNLFKESSFAYLRTYNDIIPTDFLKQNSSIDEARSKLAIFITWIKPLTMKRMIADGITIFPAGFPGVARISVLGQDKKVQQVTNLDQMVVRLMSQIIALWETITYKEKQELARSIRADSEGFIFDGNYYQEAKKQFNNQNSSVELIALMMNRLSKYSEEYQASSSDVAQALWQYKLGQEIIAPSQTDEIKGGKLNEIGLQKLLSKYLIERGILSFGRTFGRNEIDLYTHEFGESFVIETKIYKVRANEKLLRANLVQLLSYMDQVIQPRGVLVIYNCTDDLIVAPRKWINGRLWVVAINIGKSSASARVRSIELKEDPQGSQLIICVENDSRAGVSTKKQTKRMRTNLKSRLHKKTKRKI